MVAVADLHKVFKGKIEALRGVNLAVRPGEVVVVIGPSGSGKSTLLRCLNFLEVPTRGRIVIDGVEVTHPRTDLNAVRREVGMVFQSFNLFPHLRALEKKGYLTKTAGSSRGIAVSGRASSVSLPIVGTVRAGLPEPAMEDIEGYFAIDSSQLRPGGAFFLRVKGDSMIGASILEGDLALVRPQPAADNRDIVVAMVDGEATLKRFFKERGKIRLVAANPDATWWVWQDSVADNVARFYLTNETQTIVRITDTLQGPNDLYLNQPTYERFFPGTIIDSVRGEDGKSLLVFRR